MYVYYYSRAVDGSYDYAAWASEVSPGELTFKLRCNEGYWLVPGTVES